MDISLPPTFLLPNRLSQDELQSLEKTIGTALTYNIFEAKLVLGRVPTKQRALFELRGRKLFTEEVVSFSSNAKSEEGIEPSAKRRHIENMSETQDGGFETASESEVEKAQAPQTPEMSRDRVSAATTNRKTRQTRSNGCLNWRNTVKVVKLSWLEESLKLGSMLPISEYLVYEGKVLKTPSPEVAHTRSPPNILLRAAEDAVEVSPKRKTYGHQRLKESPTSHHPPRLHHQTTSEHDAVTDMPPLPDFLRSVYSCQRPTPLYSPNDPFICELKKIKQIRTLRNDEIGVLAYAHAIASIAAYPYPLATPQEVLRLPSCGEKYGRLFQEWKEHGRCEEAAELENNEELQVLNTFWNIWGVASTTARSFYDKGWRDLDDIVEFGWDTLNRHQQVGVKYYDEFMLKIPRREVEQIGEIIITHAVELHHGFKMCIVGGYRRGKPESGDVDIILSHPDEDVTAYFVEDITRALEDSGYISQTLTLSKANSERGQVPVSWKGNATIRGSGFDTLDKAMVVWQDADWPTREEDLAANSKAKNPNVHRRVDILVSPWKTFGCAVMGWTSGTTFNRDLRKYCKQMKNLKFDSSGIRNREDGQWVDFESKGGRAPDYLTGERRIFEGLGLKYIEPELRCTG